MAINGFWGLKSLQNNMDEVFIPWATKQEIFVEQAMETLREKGIFIDGGEKMVEDDLRGFVKKVLATLLPYGVELAGFVLSGLSQTEEAAEAAEAERPDSVDTMYRWTPGWDEAECFRPEERSPGYGVVCMRAMLVRKIGSDQAADKIGTDRIFFFSGNGLDSIKKKVDRINDVFQELNPDINLAIGIAYDGGIFFDRIRQWRNKVKSGITKWQKIHGWVWLGGDQLIGVNRAALGVGAIGQIRLDSWNGNPFDNLGVSLWICNKEDRNPPVAD